MEKTSIDTSMLPNIWITWETTKGQFWLECRTGNKTDVKPNIEFKWQNKNDILIKNGSHPYMAYIKYHKKIDMLEVAVVTIDTTRKAEVHEWKYAGDKYFINKNKVIFNENGDEHTGIFNLYKYHSASRPKDFLSMLVRLTYNNNAIEEIKKFIGDSYTIGNGRVVDVTCLWHLQDWYIKKTGKPTNGKQQKLVDNLTAIPLSDISDFAEKYPVIEMGSGWYDRVNHIMYFERIDDDWSVLRMIKRVNNEVSEMERIYLHDNGTSRIATRTKNGWIPSKQNIEYCNYYQFVNKDEAMARCPRLKYIIPLFATNEKNIKKYIITALRFPEIEQLMKLGHTDTAKRIANSNTPRADLRHEFGEYYNDKESNILRKISMTKYQLDKHLKSSRNTNWWKGNVLKDMREYFGDDLSHIDNVTFDKYYDTFETIRNRAYGLNNHIVTLNLDYKKFIKNTIRLNEKSATNIFIVIRDIMNAYAALNRGTQPEINWYFDSCSDVMRAHDAITALREEQRAEQRAYWNMKDEERRKKDEEKRIKLDKERKKYEYEDDNYIIRLPKNGTEIIDEGSKQKICIGGYVSSHSLGNTNLFFIRKKSDPDTPFYAIEMNRNNQINQIHGYCNKWLGCDPDVIPTVIRWLRKNNIKCDDKILTCKSTGYGAINEYVPMPVVI